MNLVRLGGGNPPGGARRQNRTPGIVQVPPCRSALTWGDVSRASAGAGVLVRVRQSKTDQDGTAADVRYLKNGCAVALRGLRDSDHRAVVRAAPGADRPSARGLNGQPGL